jgi:integrase
VVRRSGLAAHPRSDLAKAAGLPAIRLHDARHTRGTLMHLRGVPTAVISKWLGHAPASFTMATYVHSQDDPMTAAGATLASALAPVKFRETQACPGPRPVSTGPTETGCD